MEKLRKSIAMAAPLEKVFAYLENPQNLPEIWPSMLEVRGVRMQENGRKAYDWTYKMAGVRLEGCTEHTGCIPNRRLETTSQTGIHSRFTWEFSGKQNQTIVTVEVTYSIPVAVLGHLAETFIRQLNEREAETVLSNLKARMETREPLRTV